MVGVGSDLVVEILSHNDTVYRVEEKVDDWLANGCSMVVTLTTMGVLSLCIAQDSRPQILRGNESFDGGDVVPGFRLPLSDILPKQLHNENSNLRIATCRRVARRADTIEGIARTFQERSDARYRRSVTLKVIAKMPSGPDLTRSRLSRWNAWRTSRIMRRAYNTITPVLI